MRGLPASVGGLAAIRGRRRTFGGAKTYDDGDRRGSRSLAPGGRHSLRCGTVAADIQASGCDRIAKPAQTLASLVEDAANAG
jgi:hypothetical protein